MTDEDEHELHTVTMAVARTTPAMLADGSWLLPVVREVLGDYADTPVDALVAAHGGLTGEALIDARIARAQRRSLVAGGLSAATYATVVAGGVLTGGWTAAVALPAAVASFAFDVFSTARIQLRLGWDLALLHDHPLDPSDDDHLLDLARLSYGVDPDGATRSVAGGFLPLAARLGNRAATDVAMASLGRKLVQRGLGRFAVPALGVPLCAGVNYVTTGRIAANARQIFRGHRRARGDAGRLAVELASTPTLLLEALLWIAAADGRTTGVEVRLVDDLERLLVDRGALPDIGLPARDPEVWLADLDRASPELRAAIHAAAVGMAELDGVLHAEEIARLQRLTRGKTGGGASPPGLRPDPPTRGPPLDPAGGGPPETPWDGLKHPRRHR